MKVLILKPRMRCRETLFGAEYNRIVGEIKENKITVIDPGLFDYEIVDIDSVFTKTPKESYEPCKDEPKINLGKYLGNNQIDVANLYPKHFDVLTYNPSFIWNNAFKEFINKNIEKKKEKNMNTKIKVDPHDVVNRISSICRVLDLELALLELKNTPEKCLVHINVSDPKTHKDMGIYIWPNELECGWGAGIYNDLKEYFDVKCDKNGFAIKEYCKHDIELTKDIYRHMLNSRYGAKGEFGIPKIKDVKFNGPATIVFWADDTKTVVKCGEDDIFDPEKGIAMAIARKALGNKHDYFNVIEKYAKRYRKEKKEDIDDFGPASFRPSEFSFEIPTTKINPEALNKLVFGTSEPNNVQITFEGIMKPAEKEGENNE